MEEYLVSFCSSIFGADENKEAFANLLPNETGDDADVRVQNSLHLEAVGQARAAGRRTRNSERPKGQVTTLLPEGLKILLTP